VPPFVIQLAGEYVIEIISAIRDRIDHFDPPLYRSFLIQNPAFYELTRQRIYSYWNCYHRREPKSVYAGFHVIEALDRLISEPETAPPD
jgi:hypothetical protein